MPIHEGAVGVSFVYQVQNEDGSAADISLATVKKLIFKRPNLTRLEKVAVFYSDGTDGRIKYTTVDATELMPYGSYECQAYIEKPGFAGYLDVALFDVGKIL